MNFSTYILSSKNEIFSSQLVLKWCVPRILCLTSWGWMSILEFSKLSFVNRWTAADKQIRPALGHKMLKFECKAAKFNRKRPLLPPVGISGTAPNKNRSLLRPVRQLSQKCRSLYFGWKKWRHGVYSSSLLLNMYVTRTRPMWARGSVTVVLGYVDIDGTKNVRQ